ncbi:hypothetical protein HY404_01575 [Candidatus Microgenomates bacterium]|nr:hypothetical protein [Candidatus Microgenomates bacterium]
MRTAQSNLRDRLKLKHLAEQRQLAQKHPHALKFLADKAISLGKIRDHSARMLAAGALAGTLSLSSPSARNLTPQLPPPVFEKLISEGVVLPEDPQQFLQDQLAKILPDKIQPLDRETEKSIGLLLERLTGIRARATLEGEHLNTTYGKIGAEQHLRRFPGDTLNQHSEPLSEGMAPGRGAWGYFSYSKPQLTPDLVEKEKWYAVVQTLYLSDWQKRLPYLREWYKYRKVMIVNTDNGRAVVAAIADSGPAAWTGKHFGGSPEVMNELGGLRYKKGPVILFFVDDPENQVPLGPVDYNRIKKPAIAEQA